MSTPLTLLLDVDGVLTTGQFLYSAAGKTYKVFGAHDADGIKLLRNKVKIECITADHRGFAISQRRVQDMGLELHLVPEADRTSFIAQHYGFDRTIFMGDGFYDAKLINQCLVGIAPSGARPEAQSQADYVTPSRAAEGAVLDACLYINNHVLNQAVLTQHIDTTDRYTYQRLRPGSGTITPEFSHDNRLHTFFVHTGSATIEIKQDEKLFTHTLTAGQGYYVTPRLPWRILPHHDGDVFHVSSIIESPSEPIYQIVDTGTEQLEQPLDAYGLIHNPKRVDKPWGHELWIMWTRDYHVLKQIAMYKGQQSSLQLHRHKLETNYLVTGQADVIDQLPLDTTTSEPEMSTAIKKINLSKYIETKHSGMHWTSSPGIVHRVIARTDYLAYETSTPELDDVIRLQDDSNRASGRIATEHIQPAI